MKKETIKRIPPEHEAKGQFVICRSIFTDPFLNQSEPFTHREAMLWLQSEASWRPRTIDGPTGPIYLEVGELSHSLNFLSEAWGWDREKVRVFLKKLTHRLTHPEAHSTTHRPTHSIATRIVSGQKVISVCNYCEIQTFGGVGKSSGDVANTQANTQGNTQGNTQANTPKRTPSKHLQTPSKQYNAFEGGRIEVATEDSSGRSNVTNFPPGFNEFWAVYPDKTNERRAAQAYQSALKIATKEEINEGAQHYSQWMTNQKNAQNAGAIDFVPALQSPANWLEAGRWTDRRPFTKKRMVGEAV